MKFGIALLLIFAFSCSKEAAPEELTSVSAKASIKQTATIGGLEGITGTSTLYRNKNGITVNFKAKNLYPGAYTIWWVIWNNPEDCGIPNECADSDFGFVEVEVLYAGGHVVGNNGKGNISAHLKAGDVSGSINDLFELPAAGGLQAGNTFDAEVHIVLRTHGPKVPGLVNEQISSYAGGCDTPFLIPPFTAYPDEIGQCADIAAAVFSPAPQ